VATFFATPREFRAWLKDHHAAAGEFVVGYYGTRRASMGRTAAGRRIR
jgi:hypothetical protein